MHTAISMSQQHPPPAPPTASPLLSHLLSITPELSRSIIRKLPHHRRKLLRASCRALRFLCNQATHSIHFPSPDYPPAPAAALPSPENPLAPITALASTDAPPAPAAAFPSRFQNVRNVKLALDSTRFGFDDLSTWVENVTPGFLANLKSLHIDRSDDTNAGWAAFSPALYELLVTSTQLTQLTLTVSTREAYPSSFPNAAFTFEFPHNSYVAALPYVRHMLSYGRELAIFCSTLIRQHLVNLRFYGHKDTGPQELAPCLSLVCNNGCSLTHLELSGGFPVTELSAADVSQISCLTALRSLRVEEDMARLDDAQLHGSFWEALAELTALTCLDVNRTKPNYSSNIVTTFDIPSTWTSLILLQQLSIKADGLNGVELLSSLVGLTSLSVWGVPSTALPALLQCLTRLAEVDLGPRRWDPEDPIDPLELDHPLGFDDPSGGGQGELALAGNAGVGAANAMAPVAVVVTVAAGAGSDIESGDDCPFIGSVPLHTPWWRDLLDGEVVAVADNGDGACDRPLPTPRLGPGSAVGAGRGCTTLPPTSRGYATLPSSFQHLSQLTSLKLRCMTQPSHLLSMRWLPAFTALRTLSLSAVHLTHQSMAALASMPHLTHLALYLQQCPPPMHPPACLPSLQTLTFEPLGSSTRPTGAHSEHVHNFLTSFQYPDLQELNVPDSVEYRTVRHMVETTHPLAAFDPVKWAASRVVDMCPGDIFDLATRHPQLINSLCLYSYPDATESAEEALVLLGDVLHTFRCVYFARLKHYLECLRDHCPLLRVLKIELETATQWRALRQLLQSHAQLEVLHLRSREDYPIRTKRSGSIMYHMLKELPSFCPDLRDVSLVGLNMDDDVLYMMPYLKSLHRLLVRVNNPMEVQLTTGAVLQLINIKLPQLRSLGVHAHSVCQATVGQAMKRADLIAID